MDIIKKAREEVVETARLIHKEGLVPETWGNVSSRPTENEIVITPSGISYEKLNADDMVVVDLEGNIKEGKWKPSTELMMHAAIYESRSDVKAIVHTHSIYSTVFAVSRREMPVVLEEQAQVVGGPVKVTEYALPGTQELAKNAVKTLGEKGTVFLLANHGLVGVGDTLSSALQKCKIVERSAMILLWSHVLGKPEELNTEEVAALREKYLKYYGQ